MRSQRPGYEGMGLGLFIAKTMLERSGAELSFANGSDPYIGNPGNGERTGAIIECNWPRSALVEDEQSDRRPLGRNVPIEV